MEELRKCKNEKCKKTFVPKRKTQWFCCNECRIKWNSEIIKSTKKVNEADVKTKRNPKRSLQDISNEARKLDMSYGQYVAMIEM